MKRFIILLVMAVFTITNYAQDVYVLNAHSRLEPVMRAVTAGTKIKGNALLSAYGGKLKTVLLLDGKSAELTLPLGATYFYIHTPKNISIKSWKLTSVESKKKNREYGFHLQTILKQINYFGKNGINLGISYDNILRKEKVSNKTHLLKQFIGNITQVMEELKSKKNIDGFETKNFDKKPSVLNYDKYYILLTLLPKKLK